MKIIGYEVIFTLSLPRELEGDEVSDLACQCEHTIELVCISEIIGADLEPCAYLHTFGLTDDMKEEPNPTDVLAHAQLAAMKFIGALAE